MNPYVAQHVCQERTKKARARMSFLHHGAKKSNPDARKMNVPRGRPEKQFAASGQRAGLRKRIREMVPM